MGYNNPLQPTIYTTMWLCCGVAVEQLSNDSTALVSWSVSYILLLMQNVWYAPHMVELLWSADSAPYAHIGAIAEWWHQLLGHNWCHALGTLVMLSAHESCSLTSWWCSYDIIMTSLWPRHVPSFFPVLWCHGSCFNDIIALKLIPSWFVLSFEVTWRVLDDNRIQDSPAYRLDVAYIVKYNRFCSR
jgi:hypothetical protein